MIKVSKPTKKQLSANVEKMKEAQKKIKELKKKK